MRARLLVLVMAFAVAIGVAAPRASAHDVLEGSNPKDGSTVATAPGSVKLTFNSPPVGTGAEIVVSGPSGQVSQGEPKVVDREAVQQLQPGAPAGKYTVRWRVTSSDGHPISGTFTFTARAAAAGASSPTSASSAPSSGAAAASSAATPAASSASAQPEDAGDSSGISATSILLIVVGALVLIGLVVVGLRRTRETD